jgi:hypothetical protein
VTALDVSQQSLWDKRLEVVSRFMLLGNMRVVAEQTNIHYTTLMEWKKSEWWPDLVEQLKRQKKNKQNDSLTKIIEQSLDILQDRLEGGDWVHDQKRGGLIRKPVSAKDAVAIANSMMQRQEIIEAAMERSNDGEETREEQLLKLAQEFQRWAKKKQNKEVIDVEVKEV